MALRRLPSSGSFLPLFAPQLGASIRTAISVTATPSVPAAIPSVDGGVAPMMMSIHCQGGGRVRVAFFNSGDGGNVATSASLLVGYGATEWTREVGIPEGATHFSFIRANAADVDIEIAWA